MPRKHHPPTAAVSPESATGDVSFDATGEVRTTETEVVIAPPSSLGSRPMLTLLSGVNAGQLFAIERAETVLGRAREAWVRLDDVGISRRHARIVRTGPAAFEIEDLDSTNGVYVNGERVSRASLTPGDQVQVGSEVILRFSMVDAAEEALARQLFESSTRDALTGAWNRKYLAGRLAAEVAYAERHRARLALLLFDLDHFKNINDKHGHVAGDAVLRNVGLVVARLLRTEDVFARYGGEEFVVLVRGIGADNVLRLAQRIRKAVADARVAWVDGDLRMTLSVGIAHLEEAPAQGAGGLIGRADARLYRAKGQGRNCVVAD
jgi:two-component system cell cycle response regulator